MQSRERKKHRANREEVWGRKHRAEKAREREAREWRAIEREWHSRYYGVATAEG